MKRFLKYFLEGILILLPIALTIYIVVAVFELTDGILGKYFKFFGINIPGLGLLTSIILITLVGILASWFFSRRLINGIDYIFGNMPLVRVVYNIIKDTMQAVLGSRNHFGQTVLITLPGDDQIKILGYITTEDLELFGLEDHVAVYILQSMQWAGFTLLVPRSRIQVLEISPDQSLQFIVSAGMTGSRTND